MNLEISSEYLVLASELLEIKSRMLLPNNKSEDEEDEELDPREELVNQIINHMKEYEYYNYHDTYEDDGDAFNDIIKEELDNGISSFKFKPHDMQNLLFSSFFCPQFLQNNLNTSFS